MTALAQNFLKRESFTDSFQRVPLRLCKRFVDSSSERFHVKTRWIFAQ